MSRQIFRSDLSSDQDDSSDDDIYKPEEDDDEESDYDSDFEVSKAKSKRFSNSKFDLQFDDELIPTSKMTTKRIRSDKSPANAPKPATKKLDFNIDWDDSTLPPLKKFKSKPFERDPFDSSSESESEDQKDKKESLLDSWSKAAKAKRAKGKNREGVLDVLNDENYRSYQNNAFKPKKKMTNALDFSDVEEDLEDPEDSVVTILPKKRSDKDLWSKLKDLTSSDSESDSASDQDLIETKKQPSSDKESRRDWFFRFSKKIRPAMTAQFPSYDLTGINRLIGQSWNELSEADKRSYSQEEISKKVAHAEPESYHDLLDAQENKNASSSTTLQSPPKNIKNRKIPTRPTGNGYILYSTEEMPKVRQRYPDVKSVNQLSSIVGNDWRKLDQEKREEYNARARQQRDEWIRKYPEAHEEFLQKMKAKVSNTKKAQNEMKRLKKLRKEMKKKSKRFAKQDSDEESD